MKLFSSLSFSSLAFSVLHFQRPRPSDRHSGPALIKLARPSIPVTVWAYLRRGGISGPSLPLLTTNGVGLRRCAVQHAVNYYGPRKWDYTSSSPGDSSLATNWCPSARGGAAGCMFSAGTQRNSNRCMGAC